jgi:hypothetical protein
LNLVNESKQVCDWATHKQHKVIMAGLNKACSLIPAAFYDNVRNFTNAVEQSHYKSYFLGVYDSLLGATIRYKLVTDQFLSQPQLIILDSFLNNYSSQGIDQRELDQHYARNQYGTSHTYRSTDLTTRYYNHMGREREYKNLN